MAVELGVMSGNTDGGVIAVGVGVRGGSEACFCVLCLLSFIFVVRWDLCVVQMVHTHHSDMQDTHFSFTDHGNAKSCSYEDALVSRH